MIAHRRTNRALALLIAGLFTPLAPEANGAGIDLGRVVKIFTPPGPLLPVPNPPIVIPVPAPVPPIVIPSPVPGVPITVPSTTPPKIPVPVPQLPVIVDTPLIPAASDNPATRLVKASNEEIGKISGNIIREAGIGYANLERQVKTDAGNVDTSVRKAGADIERTVRQTGGDVGRELRTAADEIESAAVAIYRFTLREAESSKDAVSNAEQRFREGKVIDAVWHLGVDPAQGSSKNAASAASESAVLNTIGSVAASAYGGPGGAAAYAAWLAYYQTGGDVNAALRVGLTAAVQSYAGQYAKVTPAGATVSEAFKKAATGGALSGLAVAASGGSAEDVRNAMLATAGGFLVQDGYQALAANESVASFAKTARQVYCVKTMVDNNEDKTCPGLKDYLKDDQGRYAMLDTKGKVQYINLEKEVLGKH